MAADARAVLATMPLHAITTTYGQQGLRDRLFLELAALPAADRRRVEAALNLAARLHAADRRQREPYLNHVLRVAIRILSYYGVRDPDVLCAALLHDAVEDHAADLAADGSRQGALTAIEAEFGPRVSRLVDAVTNPDYDPGANQHEQYRDHVAASLDRCPWARVIKISDFTDNGVGLIHTTGPLMSRLAGKYAPLVPVLRALVTRPDTPLDQPVKDRILRQLDQAAERFRAILPQSGP